jgi:hypothetical protein
MATVYVVLPLGSRDGPKAFATRASACAFAEEQVAGDVDRVEIFEVTLSDVPLGKEYPAAIAALRMGEGRLLEARCSRISDVAYQQAREREWERAKASGLDAALKFLGIE